MYYEQSILHKCVMYLNLYFSGCCYFLSSAINPFLYSLLSKRFRRGFHDLKYKLLRHCRLVPSRTSNSRLSYGRQQGTRPIMSLRNKQSFRFKSRQLPTFVATTWPAATGEDDDNVEGKSYTAPAPHLNSSAIVIYCKDRVSKFTIDPQSWLFLTPSCGKDDRWI